jgi:hypothetical protein
MTDTEFLSSAAVLAGQLEDILVAVPLDVLERLTGRERHLVFDWCELAADLAVRQQHVPVCEVGAVRKCFDEWQRLGKWEAFTNFRPAEKPKTQASLFVT